MTTVRSTPPTSPSTAASAVPSPPGSGRRRVAVTEFVTLDGYIVGPDEDISWVLDDFAPEMIEEIARVHVDAGTFLLGRTTYEIFAGYWPTAVPLAEDEPVDPASGREDPRVIRALNECPKVVASTTIDQPDWAGTTVVAGDLAAEVRRMRSEPGGTILVEGSASVVQALARADLVDEYHLYVHPVLLGAGTPLFAGGDPRRDFRLASTTTYPNGVIAVTYQRKDGADR